MNAGSFQISLFHYHTVFKNSAFHQNKNETFRNKLIPLIQYFNYHVDNHRLYISHVNVPVEQLYAEKCSLDDAVHRNRQHVELEMKWCSSDKQHEIKFLEV